MKLILVRISPIQLAWLSKTIEISNFQMNKVFMQKLHLNLDTCKVGNEAAHKILWNVWPNTTDDKSVNIEYWVFLESGKRANTNTMRTWNISICLPLMFLLFYSLHFILLKIQNIDLKVRSIFFLLLINTFSWFFFR